MVSASIYNVFLCYLSLSVTFQYSAHFFILPEMCQLLITFVFVKCHQTYQTLQKMRIFPKTQKLSAFFSLHCYWAEAKLLETLNDRHLLSSEILWLVLQLLMAALLLSLNYLPEMFSPTADCPAPMYYFNCSSAGPGATGSECQKSCKTQDMHCVRNSPPSRGTGQRGWACRIALIKH